MSGDMGSVLVLIGAAVVVGVLLLVFIGRSQTTKTLNTAWYREQWEGITKQAEDGAAGRQLAILNADKLLDRAMRERGLKGENMGDRLKKNPGRFKKINSIWSAHKLRNHIAHESNVNISSSEVHRALNGFETGLKDMGAL